MIDQLDESSDDEDFIPDDNDSSSDTSDDVDLENEKNDNNNSGEGNVKCTGIFKQKIIDDLK